MLHTADGPDTALARVLHARGLLPLATIQTLLGEVRQLRARHPDASLALVLLERRLVDPGALDAAQSEAGGPPPPRGPGAPDLGRLGPYRLTRELARGGQGAVFEAVHQQTGAAYALKTVLPDTGDDALERFSREAQLAARLDHRHIARVHAADYTGPRPYIVHDLLPGGSLHERLEADGPLEPAELRALGAKLADALEHAHAAGVLHRDLKPHNVLFDEHGEPIIVDFGLAVALGTESQRLTQTGTLLGTPSFMAPEQANTQKDVDARTDVYGLGALLYAALCGRPPFQERQLFRLLDAIFHKAPPPPHELRPELPPGLSAILLKALAKERAARYPSAAAFAEALRAAEAAPPRRGRGWLLAAGVCGLAALGLAAALRPEASLPEQPPATPQASTPPASPWPAPPGTLRWSLAGDRPPTLVAPALWADATGTVAVPLRGVEEDAPEALAAAFRGSARRDSSGRITVRWDLERALRVEPEDGPAVVLSQGRLLALRRKELRVRAPTVTGGVWLHLGEARWKEPELRLRVRRLTEAGRGLCHIELGSWPPDEAAPLLSFQGQARRLTTERVATLLSFGADYRSLSLRPGAPPGKRLRLGQQGLPALDRDLGAPAAVSAPRLRFEGGQFALGLCELSGRPLRVDRPAWARVEEDLPAAAWIRADFRQEPAAAGGACLALGDPDGRSWRVELDGARLVLFTGSEVRGLASLPASPEAGRLLLRRDGPELVARLEQAGAEAVELRCLEPLPLGARPQAAYGSSGPRVRFRRVEVGAGASDPAREAFDAAGIEGSGAALAMGGEEPRALWRRGALRLAGCLSLRWELAAARGGGLGRAKVAAQALRELRRAVQLESGPLRRDALARGLLAAVVAGERAAAVELAGRLREACQGATDSPQDVAARVRAALEGIGGERGRPGGALRQLAVACGTPRQPREVTLASADALGALGLEALGEHPGAAAFLRGFAQARLALDEEEHPRAENRQLASLTAARLLKEAQALGAQDRRLERVLAAQLTRAAPLGPPGTLEQALEAWDRAVAGSYREDPAAWAERAAVLNLLKRPWEALESRVAGMVRAPLRSSSRSVLIRRVTDAYRARDASAHYGLLAACSLSLSRVEPLAGEQTRKWAEARGVASKEGSSARSPRDRDLANYVLARTKPEAVRIPLSARPSAVLVRAALDSDQGRSRAALRAAARRDLMVHALARSDPELVTWVD